MTTRQRQGANARKQLTRDEGDEGAGVYDDSRHSDRLDRLESLVERAMNPQVLEIKWWKVAGCADCRMTICPAVSSTATGTTRTSAVAAAIRTLSQCGGRYQNF